MVDGGDHIFPAEWKTVSNIIQRVCMFCIVLLFTLFSFGLIILVMLFSTLVC